MEGSTKVRLRADSKVGRGVDEASCLVGLNTRQDASFTFDYRFFDPHAEIENVAGNLPHWRQDSVLYIITFRTADALSVEKLLMWQKEKEAWAAAHPEPWDAVRELRSYRSYRRGSTPNSQIYPKPHESRYTTVVDESYCFVGRNMRQDASSTRSR